jgi:hypothetical protein
MAASYPGTLKSFTTKTNKVDLVDAAHINSLQEEIVAVQTELGVDVAGSCTDLVTRLYVCMGNNGALRQGTSFPANPVVGQMFWRTDLNALYICSDAGTPTWQAIGNALSNLIYCYNGWDPGMGAAGYAEYTGTTEEGVTMTYRHLYNTDSNPQVVRKAKFIKVSGINTVTILARLKNTAGATAATLTVNVGGQSAAVSRTATTFDWADANTIDVSGLTNGTTYDITFTLNADGTPLCSAIMLFGS